IRIYNPPARTGYTFTGWTAGLTPASGTVSDTIISAATVGTGTGDANGLYQEITVNPGAAITLTAHWAIKTGYSVAYDGLSGATPSTYSTLSGLDWDASVLVPATDPTRTGYTFAGWKLTKRGTDAVASADQVSVFTSTDYATLAVDDSVMTVTLSAQWTVKAIYSVDYDLAGGTVAGTTDTAIAGLASVAWTDTGLVPSGSFTKYGYELSGWKLIERDSAALASPLSVSASDSYGPLTGDDDTVTSIKIQAAWTPKTDSAITLDPNGGTDGTVKQLGSLEFGSSLSSQGKALPSGSSAPVWPGRTFVGWSTTPTGSVDISDGDIVDWEGAITLYAVWSTNTYRVNYVLDGGKTAAGLPLIDPKLGVRWDDAGLVPSDVITKDGYTLAGWTLSGKQVSSTDSYGALAQDDTVDEITLTAKWEANAPEPVVEEPKEEAPEKDEGSQEPQEQTEGTQDEETTGGTGEPTEADLPYTGADSAPLAALGALALALGIALARRR
ncbi:MAG: InlB B-repeat-containing protein, partial [Propionibacteriaceae bacterium]|nr:InlB B-repeat-containing protein [Propionibacteriaceae bacterium]